MLKVLEYIGGKGMNGFEKLIKVIREESGRDTDPFPLKLGVISIEGSKRFVNYKGIRLEKDDFYFPINFWNYLEAGDLVLFSRVSDDKFAIITKVEEG